MEFVETTLPLCNSQQALWSLEQLAPGTPVYNQVLLVRFQGPLDPARLRAALAKLLARHGALRTVFHAAGDGPVQQVLSRAAADCPLEDLSALPDGHRDAIARRRIGEVRRQPFDLARGPLLRFRLFRSGPRRHELLIIAHHLVLDGRSAQIFAGDLMAFYLGADPAPPTLPYHEFVLRETAMALEAREADVRFWRSFLGAAPKIFEIPTDQPRPQRALLPAGTLSRWLPAGLGARVAACAREQRTSMFRLLVAAFGLLLHRITGETEAVLAATFAGRGRPGSAQMVGMFVNTLPCSVRFEAHERFCDALARISAGVGEMGRHQLCPYGEIAALLSSGPSARRWSSYSAAINQVFDYSEQSHAGEELQIAMEVPFERELTPFDLALQCAIGPQGIRLLFEYGAELFDRTTVQRIAQRFETLLRGIVAAPGDAADRLPLLDDAERQQLLVEWNDTAAQAPGELSLPGLVRLQALRRPDAAAVVSGELTLSYGELEARSSRLASRLRRLGVGAEQAVGLCCDRSTDWALGMLGILQAGGFYVPLDLEYPQERLELMVADTGMTAVLTRGELRRRLPRQGKGLRILDLDAEILLGDPPAEAGEGEAADGARLAYVLYTSGSTGRPKGIGIPHRAVARLVLGNGVCLEPGSRIAQASNLGFDASTYEIWGALVNGGTLLEISRETLLSLWKVPGELRRLGIDTLLQTPALFSQLAREQPDAFSALRELFLGGDVLDPAAVRRVLAKGGPQCLYNAYGPTECTTFALWHRVTPESAARTRLPLGRPIANTRVVLCDRHLEPVPAGAVGELCLGGEGLARGYLGRGDLTAERFVPSVLGDEPGGRLYRTGDLARWLPTGELEFLGRFDHQVKVRGFRVELGEIEAALRAHADVREAAVVLQREAAEGRLVAYVVPRSAEGPAPSVPVLRAFLARRLPDYMIPAAFVVLDELPLNANLKLDRRRLPAPLAAEEERGDAAAVGPRTGTESALAAIWEEVLERPAVGAHDDFFACGGHSLLATRVLSRVRDFLGAELSLRDLFEAPTVAGLAERIERVLREGRGLPPAPPLAPLPRPAGAAPRFPLSFGQLGLWFLDRLYPGRASYNIPVGLRLRGPLGVSALARAASAIVERHESLRTVFVAEGAGAQAGEPAQEVRPPEPLALPVVDLAGLEPAARGAEAGRLAELEALRPFDLETGPLLRGGLVRLGAEEHVLLLTVHHIVFDGWSLEVFHRELGSLYGAFREGGGPEAALLPALALQYGDFAVWQRSCLSAAVLAAELDVWRRRLGDDLPVLELPADRPRPAMPAFRGGACALRLPPGLAESLQSAGARRATRAMALLAGFQSLLHRLSGQDRVVVGMPVAGRGAREAEGLVGLFVNHLLLVEDLGDEPSFAACLERVRDGFLDASARQEMPFDQLVQALRPERDLSRNPLSQIAFAWQTAVLQAPRLAGLAVEPLPPTVRRTRFDLELHLWQAGDAVEGLCIYDTDLFDPATIERMAGHFVRLLEAAAAGPETPVSRLSFLSEAERHQILVEELERITPYPRSATLPELFARQASQRPDAVAVVDTPEGREDAALTYGELARRSRRLARRLRQLGVGEEQAVGLCFDRCADWVVGMLGILEAGGFYVPLDPRHPRERLGLMVADTGMPVVLTRGRLRHLLPHLEHPQHPQHPQDTAGLQVVDLDAETLAGPLREPAREGADPVRSTRLAYVLYTSGSTGAPKGIGVPQHAVARLVLATNYVELGPGDRMTQVSNLGFDAATFEVWGALLNGGTLIEIPREVLLSPVRVAEELRGRGIDTMLLTSAVFHHLAAEVPEAFGGLRDLLVGGDALDPVWVRRVFERGRPQRLLNGYGPTESATFAAWHEATDEDASRARIPIGRPVANTRAVVCDRRLEPVPLGVVGELCLGGDGLARGYLGRGDLTAERFVPSPMGEEAGARLYRTGDLARRLPSGELEILGRLDHQVKVRGVRVELGEIEAALRAHPAVREALAVFQRGGAEGRLVAYVVFDRTDSTDSTDRTDRRFALRAFLRERLPEPMLPAAFVFLDALPLTANGKIDRAALPLPEESRPEAGAAPRDPLEESLAAVWAEALGVPAVGTGDDFFTLGGHSLLATRVVSRVRGILGVELPLRALFESPTVAGMAESIRSLLRKEGVPAPPALVPCARPAAARVPLSFAQERLWFLDLLAPGSTFYNICYAVRLTGPLDPWALAAALGEIERRHEILRTTFPVSAGEPAQRIGPPRSPGLPRVDLGALPPARRAPEARRLQEAEAARPFALAAGPLWRTALLCLGPGDHILLLGQHHIVSDGWSVGVLHRELEALYGAFRQGRPSPLPPLGLQYADYTAWQRGWLQGEALDAQLGYWRKVVGTDLPVLELPVDRPRPPVQTFRGAARRVSLPPGLVDGLRSLGRRCGATPAVTLLAGFFALLGRLTGQSRIFVGSPTAGRSSPELEALLGFFVNSLVMVGDLHGEPPFRELLERVRATALGAYAHQDLPFERLVDALAPQRDLSRNPLFQAIFVFQNSPVTPPELPGVRSELLDFELRTTHFDLELHLWEAGAGIEGGCVFDADLFDATTIQRLLDRSVALLGAAVAGPEIPFTRLPLLADAERHLLLAEWNDTATAAVSRCGGTVADLILRQAGRRPEAVAVSGGGLQLTYGELAARSSRLAARLRGLGVGPEAVVGVLTGRTPEVAVASLAVLLAGCAFLPLDPELPPQRLGWLLRDAGAVAVVATGELAARIPDGVRRLLVEEAMCDGGGRAPAAPETADESLAYVIYTSGSTGQPKGVEVAQRSLLNLVLWHLEACGLGPEDRASQVAAVGFDISILEILSPLAAGASLQIPSEEVRRDPVRLGAWLAAAEITAAFFPTPLVHALLERPLPSGLALRSLLTGGEALHPVHAELPFRLVNLYGPTEGTVVATGGVVEKGAPGAAAPPIGRPLAGVRAAVFDAEGEPLPPGAPGELWLGGVCPARGYRGRPDLTAERFVPDPFAVEPGARMYRTGDRVRTLGDGRLEFLGRLDRQVKLRGFRIEPGEIEAALRAQAAVREAVVAVQRGGPDAEPRLIAWVEADDVADLPSALRRHLQGLLPSYMVPSAIVRLDALPLTPHGKIDRRALPLPGEALRPAATPFLAPQTAIQRSISEVWQRILAIEAIGIDDPFFDLGGNSLAMARAASLLEAALERPVPLVSLFRFPTVRSLAEHLGGGAEKARSDEGQAVREIERKTRQRWQTQDRRRRERQEHRF